MVSPSRYHLSSVQVCATDSEARGLFRAVVPMQYADNGFASLRTVICLWNLLQLPHVIFGQNLRKNSRVYAL